MRLGLVRRHAVSCSAAKRSGAGLPRDGSNPSPTGAEPSPPRTTGSSSTAGPPPLVVTIQPRGPSKPLTRSSYRARRKSGDEWRQLQEQQKKEEEQRQRKAEQALLLPVPPPQPPTLLIDAYNIMYLDPTMKSFMTATDNLGFARAELERRVQIYARASGSRCLVVYDAMGRYIPSYRPRHREEQNTKSELDERVSIVFSTTQEADSYIIDTAQELKRQGYSRVEVVSKDRRVQDESRGLLDEVITTLDATRFVQDLEDCSRGHTAGIASRVYVPSAEASVRSEWYVQTRAAAAAASQEREARSQQLPAVDSPDIEHMLVEELGSSCLDGCKGAEEAQVDTEALSADLNDLFSAPKPRAPRRPRH